MKTTKEMMEVMQAYCDGALIEACFTDDKKWWVPAEPSWNWEAYNFRIKKPVKQIKLQAWFNGIDLFWRQEKYTNDSCKRVPAEDKIIEVEE